MCGARTFNNFSYPRDLWQCTYFDWCPGEDAVATQKVFPLMLYASIVKRLLGQIIHSPLTILIFQGRSVPNIVLSTPFCCGTRILYMIYKRVFPGLEFYYKVYGSCASSYSDR